MKKLEKETLIDAYPAISDWIRSMPQAIFSRCQLTHYPRGTVLFTRGVEISRVFLICRGIVLISTSGLDGSEKCVVFSRVGETVGEMETLLRQKFLVYNAKAYSECVFLEIPSDAFVQWVEMDDRLCRKLVYELSEKLLSSSQTTVQYQDLNAEMRLRRLLSFQKPGRVRETRQMLAEACGVSERTIYRAVARLEEQGMLTVQHGRIYLTEEQLAKLVPLEPK